MLNFKDYPSYNRKPQKEWKSENTNVFVLLRYKHHYSRPQNILVITLVCQYCSFITLILQRISMLI